MKEYYQTLGLSLNASQTEIKSAYLAKLREFPAHSHPQEFKAIRLAYEKLKKMSPTHTEDFFDPGVIQVTLDNKLISSIRQKALAKVQLSYSDIVKLTF